MLIFNAEEFAELRKNDPVWKAFKKKWGGSSVANSRNREYVKEAQVVGAHLSELFDQIE